LLLAFAWHGTGERTPPCRGACCLWQVLTCSRARIIEPYIAGVAGGGQLQKQGWEEAQKPMPVRVVGATRGRVGRCHTHAAQSSLGSYLPPQSSSSYSLQVLRIHFLHFVWVSNCNSGKEGVMCVYSVLV
jgi:hypothetical protein